MTISTPSGSSDNGRKASGKPGVFDKWISVIAAVASAGAAFCAAWAAWTAVDIAKLQYESEIKRIKFSFHKINDDWEVKVSQITGQSFDLELVLIEPTLIDSSNTLTHATQLSLHTTIDPASINSQRPYPLYLIRNVKNNICRNNTCNGKQIHELRINYSINGTKKTETIR